MNSKMACIFLFSLIIGLFTFCLSFSIKKQKKATSNKCNNGSSYIFFALSFLLFITSCTKLVKNRETMLSLNLEQYAEYRKKVKYAEQGLPSLEQLGDYKLAQFSYRRVSSLLFSSEGISVFVDYDEDGYLSMLQTIDSCYDFIESPIIQENGDYSFPVSSFSYQNYDFKIAYTVGSVYHSSKTEIEYIFPKSFTMVGFDFFKKSVAYLYYYDFDLDYICDKNATSDEKDKRMIEIIENNFCWRNSWL